MAITVLHTHTYPETSSVGDGDKATVLDRDYMMQGHRDYRTDIKQQGCVGGFLYFK